MGAGGLIQMNAHKHTFTRGHTPEWHDAVPPDLDHGRTTGRLRGCSWCGSMHPSDLAAAIQAGAVGHWADFKYGWPHKWYVENIPNPHAGMLETRSWSSSPSPSYPREVREPRFDPRTGERVEDSVGYTEEPTPAAATTGGKFYTEHLQDATPEERAVIERAMGLSFTFTDDGTVSWRPAPSAEAPATTEAVAPGPKSEGG